MRNDLCFTIRFLQPFSHGRGDSGEPEWPPAPLRLFQALCAASAARWNERQQLDYAVPALQWIESQPSPIVVAVNGVPSEVKCLFYVPDNTAELLAPAWKKGEVDKGPKRTEKVVCPTRLLGETVHYLFPLPPEGCPHLEVLKTAARSITHLGWGIDMVAADARVIPEEEADRLPGHRWRAVESGGVPLRVPKPGTLNDLMRKHKAFLGRLSDGEFRPVPPLSCFDVARYYSPTANGGDPPSRPVAAFEIHRTIEDQEANPGRSRFRSFHPVRRAATVAGMVRRAAAQLARRLGYEDAWVNEHILGHGAGKHGQSTTDDRLMFLPLPSLQPVVGVGGIRRVLIVGWPGFAEFADLRRRLNGTELFAERSSQPAAVLAQLSTNDSQVQNFLKPCRTWTTVTPVVLPGYDDPDGLRRKHRRRLAAGQAPAEEDTQRMERLDQRIMGLLSKAFEQAGWPADALAGATLEYRKVGWLRGLDLASSYDLPPLTYPRLHVRITFARPVRGPLVIGAGRYRGLGLFARTE